MAIEIEYLLRKVKHMDVTLLAGEKGLNTPVSWVHMVETTEASNYLLGGEIAFITGIAIDQKHQLLTLVKNIYEHNGAGIFVNIGPFIDSVSEDVLEFCDENNFPLFIVPWKIHLVEIMRIFSSQIALEDQKAVQIAAAFKNAICFPKQEELYMISLSQHNFSVSWKYAAGVIHLSDSSESLESATEHLAMVLDNYITRQYKKVAVFTYDSSILIVFAHMDEAELKQCVDKIQTFLRKCLSAKQSYTIGIGRQTRSIRCLYKSYQQAISIEKLQRNNKISSSLIFYSDMGLYRLLLGIEDKSIVEEYYERTLGILKEYDYKNHSDLLCVLQSYLEHNGSVKETSDELFVHRNTVNYKLHKIEELLDTDLSLLNTRLELMLAIRLEDMM